MVDNPKQTAFRFFKVIVCGQSYLNLLYLLVAFPLGVFYFVFLASGLSLGISLLIVWLGIPILLLVGAGWWALASFERFMAIYLLNEDIPEMWRPSNEDTDIWTKLKKYFTNPVTWKSLIYLFLKFPLGIATFLILITLISLTLAFLTMPFTHEFLSEIQVGVFFGLGLPAWHIDSMNDALLGALIGLMLWPVTLHVTNGLAWIHAKFTKVMLSVDPMEWLNTLSVA
ncbi:MAG TPA: hypothetical protein G4O14_02090 [Anaerolineae bacterium]|nr:hypothetical protein [Anaerolineae bacterium]